MAQGVLLQHPVTRYAFALLVTGLVTVGAVAVHPVIDLLPSPPFLLAVLVVAWVAGFGPAVLTCAMSLAVIHYVFLAPLRWMDPRQLLSLPIFTAAALIMAWLATSRRRTEAERIQAEARETAARAEAERLARILRQARLITDTPLREVSVADVMRESLARIREALASDTATICW